MGFEEAVSEDAGIFGLETKREEAAIVLLPVPWEATTSFGQGTAKGPEAIRRASHQVDLEDLSFSSLEEGGIYLEQESEEVLKWNELAKAKVDQIRNFGGSEKLLSEVLLMSEGVNELVYRESQKILEEGKCCGLIGGDHSSPFGYIKALSERYENFGILHIDAHMDLRKSYEGFEYSHASIMRNVMSKLPQVSKLVSVGIRDFSKEEYGFVKESLGRISVYFDYEIFKKKQEGIKFGEIIQAVIRELPEKVYISLDIDGLDPRFCPSTGTPVPGGLDFNELCFLLELLAKSGKKVIGFDLCEVAGEAWDANVGARVLYKLCGAMIGL